MIASTIGFALMHTIVRYLADQMHPFEVAFFRNLFGIVVLIPWFVRYGIEPFRTQRFGFHLLRALVNIVAMLAFFLALSMTELARVQALSFTAPLFATLLAVFVLGERIRIRRILALLVGFSGALLIVRPGFATIDTGSLLVLFSALVWAVALIIIKVLSRTDSSVTITLYMVLLMTPLSLLVALPYWQWPNLEQLWWLLWVGLTGTAGQMLMAQAFRFADATAVMPFDFLKLVWGAILGYLVFSEFPSIWTWTGGSVIFAGAIYIAFREDRLKRQMT